MAGNSSLLRTLFAWLAVALALGPAGAQASPRLLERLLQRALPRALFEGEHAFARNLVAERTGGRLILDFRAGAEAAAFRHSFGQGGGALTRQEDLLREALTRAERRVIHALRSGRVVDEAGLLERVAREELDARFLETVAGNTGHQFFQPSSLGETAEFFRTLDDEALALLERVSSPSGLNGVRAAGADLTPLLGRGGAQGLKARGADLRFAQAEVSASSPNGFFKNLDARPLRGRPTNLSFINAAGNSFTGAQMQDVVAIGADFRRIHARGANWDGIDVRFADLRGADLQKLASWNGAKWRGALIDSTTRLPEGMTRAQALNTHGMRLPGQPFTGTPAQALASHRRAEAQLLYRHASQHMLGDRPVRTWNGIRGGHSLPAFETAIRGQGVVVTRAPVPEFPGMSKVKYRLFRRTSAGAVTAELETRQHSKTLFDPAIWTREKLEDLAYRVFGYPAREGEITAIYRGVTFTGIVQDGRLVTFGVRF